jgi:hypothetical protein
MLFRWVGFQVVEQLDFPVETHLHAMKYLVAWAPHNARDVRTGKMKILFCGTVTKSLRQP